MAVTEKIDTLVNLYHNDKLSHVYLIETNSISQATNDILNLSKKINCENEYEINCHKCNLCNLINQNFLPSLIIIEPDGNNIKKEQVIDLKKRFSYKALYTKNNIYILKEADKLNLTAANTMLKFIEEPGENIYGFLLTRNINNVIPTIKSRCELLSLQYEDNQINDIDEYKKVAIDYISKIELENSPKIMYNRNVILNNYCEKENIIRIFQEMLKIYFEAYSQNKKILALNKLTKVELQKRINLIIKFLSDIDSNANVELLLDRFVIELSDDYD